MTARRYCSRHWPAWAEFSSLNFVEKVEPIDGTAAAFNEGVDALASSTDPAGSLRFDNYGPGSYTLDVTAVDADNDRAGDAAESTATRSVIVTRSGASGGAGSDYIRVRATNPARPWGEARAYRVIYRSGLGLEDATRQLSALAESHPEIRIMAAFLARATRGIVR